MEVTHRSLFFYWLSNISRKSPRNLFWCPPRSSHFILLSVHFAAFVASNMRFSFWQELVSHLPSHHWLWGTCRKTPQTGWAEERSRHACLTWRSSHTHTHTPHASALWVTLPHARLTYPSRISVMKTSPTVWAGRQVSGPVPAVAPPSPLSSSLFQ